MGEVPKAKLLHATPTNVGDGNISDIHACQSTGSAPCGGLDVLLEGLLVEDLGVIVLTVLLERFWHGYARTVLGDTVLGLGRVLCWGMCAPPRLVSLVPGVPMSL